MCTSNVISNFLKKINPEKAHKIALLALKYNLVRNTLSNYNEYLKNDVLGLKFDHPVGMAAGFDKDAKCVQQLLNYGFSFVEAGTITIEPQMGNSKPRLFRLENDQAIINRMGFNNRGMEACKQQLAKKYTGNVGINVGKNKDSKDSISDYVTLVDEMHKLVDYITINISSPNTPNLRKMQQKSILEKLLIAVNEKIATHKKKVPILLKISPDINNKNKEEISLLALKHKVSGLIIANTTIGCRSNLQSSYKIEYGGLSGKPLFSLSTQVLRDMYQLTKGRISFIASGGIFNGEDAYRKIKAGASLLQIYTALIYKGFKVIDEINLKLVEMLKADGFNNINEAIGADIA